MTASPVVIKRRGLRSNWLLEGAVVNAQELKHRKEQFVLLVKKEFQHFEHSNFFDFLISGTVLYNQIIIIE